MEGSADECSRDLVAALVRCLDHSTPKKQANSKRKSVHWWLPSIDELRKQSNQRRRICQRKKRRGIECNKERIAAKHAKLALVNAVKKAKKAAWDELCAAVDTDPWGKLYRLVMGRLGVRKPIPGIRTPGRMDAIIAGLFLDHPPARSHGLAT